MKVFFEFDTEIDDTTGKIYELKKIEKLILYHVKKSPSFIEGDDWLKSRPEKSF